MAEYFTDQGLLSQESDNIEEVPFEGLCNAAEEGDFDLLFSLLQRHSTEKLSILSREKDNAHLPLIRAIKRGKLECTELLLDKGWSPNHGTPTPLQIAVANGHWDIVNLLKRKGANLFVCEDKQRLPFLLALDSGYKEKAIEMLLPSDVNEENTWYENTNDGVGYGFTMLTHACHVGHLKFVKILIEECGAKIENRDIQETFDQYAHHFKHSKEQDEHKAYLGIINFLLKQVGATFTFEDGSHPFQWMATHNVWSQDLLKVLLELGFDPNIELDKDGITLLGRAARRDDAKVVRLLVQYGADPDVCNALCLTSKTDCGLECTLAIIEANPDLRIYKVEDTEDVIPKEKPLMEALAVGDVTMLSHLVSAGCCLQDISYDLNTWAASSKYDWGFDIYEELVLRSLKPRTLKESAKLAAKRCLGHIDVDEKICHLPIPQELQAYLQSTYMDPLFITKKKRFLLDRMDIPGIEDLYAKMGLEMEPL